MKFFVFTLINALTVSSNYAAADNDGGMNMLRGILPHLKKMKDGINGQVVRAADDKGEDFDKVYDPAGGPDFTCADGISNSDNWSCYNWDKCSGGSPEILNVAPVKVIAATRFRHNYQQLNRTISILCYFYEFFPSSYRIMLILIC